MAVSKLLKVGGPLLTGIGGVFATSSLVSKSADEKSEEKLKTKALTDEEPPIEEYEDANEGDCKGGKDKCKGGKTGQKASQEEGQQGSQGGDSGGEQGPSKEQPPSGGFQDVVEGEKSKGDEGKSTESEEKSEGQKKENEDREDNDNDESDSEGGGVIENGSEGADYNHASGTAYGTENRAMTKQDLENTKRTRSDLESYRDQLMKLIG